MNGIKKKWTMKSERIVRFCCCCCNFKNESNKIPEQKWEKLNKLFNEIRSKGIGMLGLLKWNYSICSSSQLNWYQEIRSWRANLHFRPNGNHAWFIEMSYLNSYNSNTLNIPKLWAELTTNSFTLIAVACKQIKAQTKTNWRLHG